VRIVYLHQYFKTPFEPGGTRSYWIAKELVLHGHEVIMITSKDLKGPKKIKTLIDGINVVYLNEIYEQNMSFYRRLWAFLSFMFKSTREALVYNNIDLIIATSTPLTIGVPALYFKYIRNVPYIFEVRDLWPEVPIQMGAMKSKVLIWCSRKLEQIIYTNASHVVALSPGMRDGVVRYISKEKISIVPNMSKIDEFWPRNKNKDLELELGLKHDSFKIVHFGAIGLANGVITIIESAKLLKNDNLIEFIFIGGGSIEEELKVECLKNKLVNVRFLGNFPMSMTSEIVNLSDVSVVSFKDIPILYTNSPNKFFDSLSAGKPILVNSAGWTKSIVEKYNCGYYVNPNNPKELADRVKYLQKHPEIVKQMGINSRKLSREQFDKSILTKQFLNIVNDVGSAKV